MRLVQALVQIRSVQPPMNPVDANISKEQEHCRREDHVGPGLPPSLGTEWAVRDCVVQLTVAAHIAEEPWQRQQVERGECFQRAHDFLPNLVFEEPGM